MVICLERGADLHMAQLMPLPLTVSCFSKIQIGFTFLVPAGPGSPGQRAVKRVCVCVCREEQELDAEVARIQAEIEDEQRQDAEGDFPAAMAPPSRPHRPDDDDEEVVQLYTRSFLLDLVGGVAQW